MVSSVGSSHSIIILAGDMASGRLPQMDWPLDTPRKMGRFWPLFVIEIQKNLGII